MIKPPEDVCKILRIGSDREGPGLSGFGLIRSPYRIFRAGTGHEAVVMAEKTLPDLSIVDAGLPDMPGADLCRKLRGTPGLERLPIIALGACQGDKITSLRAGADAFVSRDAGTDELLAVVGALLRRVQLDAGVLARGDIALDPWRNSVLFDGRPAAVLTRKQFLFFASVVKKSPAPLSADELREEIRRQSGSSAEAGAFEMLATRTRKRLGRPLGERIKGGRRFGWLYMPKPV